MSKVNIDEQHDPRTATFWAMFADEPGERENDCSTVALYENQEGEFFASEKAPRALPLTYELIKDPRKWLDERIEWFEKNSTSERC